MIWPIAGILTVTFTWVGLLFLVKRWPGDSSMTFSQHAAQTSSAQLYYAVMWSLALPPFVSFIIYGVYDRLSLPSIFIPLVIAASTLMLVAAYVPEIGGWKTTIHRLAAFSMATLFLPIVVLIALSGELSAVGRVVTVPIAMYMAWQIVFLTVVKRQHPKMLYLQGSYIALFQVAIVAGSIF